MSFSSATRSGNPELWMTDAEGNNLRQLTRLGVQSLLVPRWSPDNRHVAFSARVGTDEPQIYVIDATQDQPVPRQATHEVPGCNIPSWSRDGKTLYCSRRNRRRCQLILFRVACGEHRHGESQMERCSKVNLQARLPMDGCCTSKTADGDFSLVLLRETQQRTWKNGLWKISSVQLRITPPCEGHLLHRPNSSEEYVALTLLRYASRKIVDVAPRTTTGR
jgi:dipeptidyl aminopeptidase/acylaminoacyl peptidase